MSRKISQLLDSLDDASVTLAEADVASAEKIKEAVMKRIENENGARRTGRRLSRTALLAAALALLLAASALAASYIMQARQVAQAPAYTLTVKTPEGGEKILSTVFPDVDLAVRCDVGPGTKDVCFRAGWLPETPGIMSTYSDKLTGDLWSAAWQGDPADPPVIESEDLAPELKKAGMTAEEAGAWYSMLQFYTDESIPYDVKVYTGAELLGRDLIFFQGSAKVVKEGTLKGWQLMEIAVDTSQTGSGDPNGNYLLLFSPTEGYLLRVAGHADFATLERIAENLEVRVTERDAVSAGGMDFLLLDLGRG